MHFCLRSVLCRSPRRKFSSVWIQLVFGFSAWSCVSISSFSVLHDVFTEAFRGIEETTWWTAARQTVSFSLCWPFDDFVKIFSLTVNDCFRSFRLFSGYFFSQQFFQHQHNFWCDFHCFLSSNERLFMFMRVSSFWTKFERNSRLKIKGNRVFLR